MTDDTTLRLERVIAATPEAVFEALTTAAAMEEWYRDGPDVVARVTQHDVRVGGRYRIEFGPAGQPPFVEHGEFVEVDRPRRLVKTETLEGVPLPWVDTRVTFELRDVGGKTQLAITHEGFPSRDHRDAAAGWSGFLDRLEALLH